MRDVKALIQLPNANRLLLIYEPSYKRIPVFCVTDALSDPAKSINDSFPTCTSSTVPSALSFTSTVICRMACDLDDS